MILNKFSFLRINYVMQIENTVILFVCLFLYAAFVSNHKEIHTHSTSHWIVCKIDGMVRNRIMTDASIEQYEPNDTITRNLPPSLYYVIYMKSWIGFMIYYALFNQCDTFFYSTKNHTIQTNE